MKILVLSVLILASLSTFALEKNIECHTFYQVSWDMPVDITLKGTVVKDSNNVYSISNRYLDLAVDEDFDGYSWYTYEGESEDAISNDREYRPRKYIGHAKFIFDDQMISLNTRSEWDKSLFGYFEFLMPTIAFDSAQSGDSFEAVVIMTYIADHWGGTRTLKCIVK